MTSLLEEYARAVEKKKEAYAKCIRASGPFQIGPTNRGGMFFKYKEKDVSQDISVSELKDLRELITDFLMRVSGDEG